MAKVELQKISNPDTHLFTETGIRGGISYINKRYSKANNKYCLDYDKNKPKNFIIDLDMNNLYGGAMSEYLPYRGFKFIKNNNEIINEILNKSENSLHGYFLEVDLDYPESKHDYHNDYPQAPEKIKILEEMLSPYCSEIKNEYDIKTGDINKLVTNLMSKKNFYSLWKFTILFITRISIKKGT